MRVMQRYDIVLRCVKMLNTSLIPQLILNIRDYLMLTTQAIKREIKP